MSKATNNIIIIVAASLTLLLVGALKPNSLNGWLLFGGWLESPYIALLLLSLLSKSPVSKQTISVLGVSLIGLCWLVYIIYIAPDAQGAIGVLLVPAGQFSALLITRFIKVS